MGDLRRFIILLFFPGSNRPASAQASPLQFGQVNPIIVVAEQTPTGVRFLVDWKDVSHNTLRGIAEAYERHGDGHYPVVAIADERLSIRVLGDLTGLTGKVGLLNVRYFLLDRDTNKQDGRNLVWRTVSVSSRDQIGDILNLGLSQQWIGAIL
jgi:hypothetical protein